MSASTTASGERSPLLANGTLDKRSFSNGATRPRTESDSVIPLPCATVLEPPNQKRSRWRSIRVLYFTMFLSAITFSVTMSTIWPFLKVVDKSATPSLLGWVVAAYSLGQLVASPAFGLWSAKRNAREPLVVSLAMQVGSNLFYAYQQSLHGEGGGYLILARVLLGFASGNAAVVRAYVSQATTEAERTGAMANVSLLQSVGFILGPVLQTALVAIGYPGPVEKQGFHFNMYTAPAFLSAILAVTNLILLVIFFRLHKIEDNPTAVINDNDNDKEEDTKPGSPDYFAVFSTMGLFFIVFFVFTIFETIGTPLTMDMYGWSKSQAALYVGIMLASAGFVAIAVFIVVKMLSKRGVDERRLLVCGYTFCLVGFFIYLPWGHHVPAIAEAPLFTPITPSTTNPTTSIINNTGKPPWEEERELAWLSEERALGNPEQHRDTSDTTRNFPSFPRQRRSAVFDSDIQLSQNETRLALTQSRDRQLGADEDKESLQPSVNDGSTSRQAVKDTGHGALQSRFQVPESVFRDLEGNDTTETALTTQRDSKTNTRKPMKTMVGTSEITASTHEPRSSNITSEAPTAAATSLSASSSSSPENGTSQSSHPVTTTEPVSVVTSNDSRTQEPPTTTTASNATVAPEGCPWDFGWCGKEPRVELWQFILGTFFIAIGYPICNVMTYTLYSKVLGPQPQGLWMGFITACGSLARTLGPIFVAQIYDASGPRATFGASCGVLLLTIGYCLVIHRRLLPFNITPYRKQKTRTPSSDSDDLPAAGSLQ